MTMMDELTVVEGHRLSLESRPAGPLHSILDTPGNGDLVNAATLALVVPAATALR